MKNSYFKHEILQAPVKIVTHSLLNALAGTALLSLLSCQQPEPISFNSEIRPILNENCLVCHGGVRQLGDFSLLFPETAFALTESGKRAIVPGNHKKSELYQRLIHQDPESRMPQEAPALSDQEIQLIADWIDQGAKWEDHWAYVAPHAPNIPEINSPWIKNDIDRFILEKLEPMELTPAAMADPATLARRVSLDLTGLPPKQPWLAAFIAQPDDEGYSILMDSLMASPHFGERWAAMWMDLARYADSNGYETDRHRNIWRFRDWVINAFNSDMPFDQFTIEQLAGDLLPQPTSDQLLATAFHRNTMTNTEGGTIDEEFRMAAVMDRLNTTFEVWQSTSISCVQCHSHPYDPFEHKEYYQLMAFFNNTQDADLTSMAPSLPLWSDSDHMEIERLLNYIEQEIPPPPTLRNSSTQLRIQAALFPKLVPQDCDDFQHVLIENNGSASNHLVNFKEGLQKRLFLKFKNINLNDLQAIEYHFATMGPDARIKVYLDSLDGTLLQQQDLPFTSPKATSLWDYNFVRHPYPVIPQKGEHDLIFELINVTAKAPEGLVSLKEMELLYKDRITKENLSQQQEQLLDLRARADRTPIMKAKTAGFERITQVFDRGSRLTPTDTVQPLLPTTLLPPETIGEDRLALAQWLVSPDNALTSRVMVNRIWEQLFGTGIVSTVEDFGTQAEAATHPQLLDYLALRFREDHQWSFKQLLKEMLNSATYRQSSKVTPKKLQKDPYNQWYSRGARFRLSSEQIRDQALAVSGLLDPTIGGNSVMPVQPEGIWQVIYSAQKWETRPEDRYRRGLYTYWKRTSPYPSMISFDSPSRELCVSRRIRTNTPLQALVTLNDPVYVEAANALANRMVEGESDVRASIEKGFLLALMKTPSEETLSSLEQLYRQAQEELMHHTNQPTRDVLQNPMALVANAILNLDSFIMKE